MAVTVEEGTTEGDDDLYLYVWSLVLKIFALTLITEVCYIMSRGFQILSEFKNVLHRVQANFYTVFSYILALC